MFPSDQVNVIKEGMLAAEVEGILGQPLRVDVSTDEHLETWHYYVWQKQDETVRYLGFIPVKKPLYSGTKAARVVFQEGVVEMVSFEHQRLE